MDSVFTDWKIFPLKTKVGNLLANGKVTISGTVQISFTLVEGNNGVFASLPSRKSEKIGDNGKPIYYPDVKILDTDTYTEFQNQAKEEYENSLVGNTTTSTVTGTKATGKKPPF